MAYKLLTSSKYQNKKKTIPNILNIYKWLKVLIYNATYLKDFFNKNYDLLSAIYALTIHSCL